MRWETNPLKKGDKIAYSWYKKPVRKKFAWFPTTVGSRKIWLERYVVKVNSAFLEYLEKQVGQKAWNHPNKDSFVVDYIRRSYRYSDAQVVVTRYLPEDLL